MLTPQEIAAEMLNLATSVAVIDNSDPAGLLMQIVAQVSVGQLCIVRQQDDTLAWTLADGSFWNPANRLPA